MKLKQKKNKKLPEIKNKLCNIYVCALNGANKMLLGINQAFISENYHCKWNNSKEISWAHWLLISHFLGEHSLDQLLLLTTGLHLYMEYSAAQLFLRFIILILYGFVFFQPSTLALALLSHELVYVSNNWFMATQYLQHEGKVWFVRL